MLLSFSNTPEFTHQKTNAIPKYLLRLVQQKLCGGLQPDNPISPHILHRLGLIHVYRFFSAPHELLFRFADASPSSITILEFIQMTSSYKPGGREASSKQRWRGSLCCADSGAKFTFVHIKTGGESSPSSGESPHNRANGAGSGAAFH